jgi:hypothetical protein
MQRSWTILGRLPEDADSTQRRYQADATPKPVASQHERYAGEPLKWSRCFDPDAPNLTGAIQDKSSDSRVIILPTKSNARRPKRWGDSIRAGSDRWCCR